jgi:hypothetical protein
MWQPFARFKKDECSRTRGLLSDYVDQSLAPDELVQLEEHLRTCPSCREELRSLRATVSLLRGLPEVTPSRGFAVAPVRPLPGRRALPALRFATAMVVLLLVMAFAADQTNLFENRGRSYLGWGAESKGEEVQWTVAGIEKSVDTDSKTPAETRAELVVPDGADNVYAAVNSLAVANDGALCAEVSYSRGEVRQVVLENVAGGVTSDTAPSTASWFIMTATDNAAATTHHFAISGEGAYWSEVDALNAPVLNMVPVESDNNVLYSFNLDEAEREVIAGEEDDWLRALEYGLIGLTAVLGGTAALLWLRQRRARAAQVSENRN